MSSNVTELIRDSLPLIGVVVGGVLGAWLNSAADTRHWRREFTLQVYRDDRDFLGQALVAVHALHIALHHLGSALQGQPAPADAIDRITRTTEEFRHVLGLMGTRAQPGVQNALAAYDHRREAVINAANAMNRQSVQPALAALDQAVEDLNTAVQTSQAAITVHLARYMLPWRTRMWRKLRKESLAYL